MEADMKPLPPDPEMPILIKPYTLEECQRIVITTYNEILTFQTGYACRESTGANVLGWRDERRVLENDQFQFSVRKIFYGRTAAELSLGGWQVNSTPKFRNVYTESIDVTFHVLQQVDADNVVMYRVLHSLDGLYVNKTLFLTTRLRTETGYIILFRSLDPEGRIMEPKSLATEPEVEADVGCTDSKKQHRWLNLYSWVIFDEVGENGEHCFFDFNGILPNQSGEWMLEMLLVAMRWENIVVGPLFTLQ
uniref:START domain-containing protein n=1 Tax=Globisporangium ultimum (strain ATCC 200006 / CBS 805.95 / DAOM BR144) TaxID=431595 RepID=K3XD90_GLOUD